MKIRGALLILSLSFCLGSAQEESVSFEDLAHELGAWAQENLDTNVLAAITQTTDAKTREFLQALQQELQNNYVLDLAALKDAAEMALPLLEQYEETYPLSLWLRTRMDYFRVAEQLRSAAAHQTRPTNQPVAITHQREVWVTEVSRRPWPPAASNYVSLLKPVFAAEKIPPELVWIAEVESSFDPRARSPVGATGLFQLMPATAKRFGLSLWPRDQRLQPGPSATASAKYLKYLHDRFQNWPLALAAYNAGEGRVGRLLKEHRANSFDQIASRLPAETQLYVPKIEATLLRREGLKLADLSPTR